MAEQGNAQQLSIEGEQGKKPIALAVVLVLLVISLIFVILFATKSIGNKQELQVETGKRIVEHFIAMDKSLTYTESSIAALLEREQNWTEDTNIIAMQTKYLFDGVTSELEGLFAIASTINGEGFNDESNKATKEWLTSQTEQLTELAEGGSRPSAVQVDQLKSLQLQLQGMKGAVQQFNFKLEGNRNAMIRLSSGFDWIELAEQLQQMP